MSAYLMCPKSTYQNQFFLKKMFQSNYLHLNRRILHILNEATPGNTGRGEHVATWRLV